MSASEFIQERPWVLAKFGMLFALVVGFVWYNFSNPILGLALATFITVVAFANWKIFDQASDAFLDIQEEDDAKQKSQKVATTALTRIFYTCLDYGLAVASIALVVAMKKFGYSYLATVATMWLLIDISSAIVSVWIYEKKKRDITTARSYRRMVDAIMQHSKKAGIIAMIYESTLAAFWSGPDYVVIFFRDELKTRTRMAVALVLISSLHSFVWTAVYWFSYENVLELVKYLFS
jgi:hypothetical protein